MTVFTLNIHHKGHRGNEVPFFVKKIFFGFVARILFIHLELGNEDPKKKGMVSRDYLCRK